MTPLLGFAPDVDPTTPGVITECTNFIPTLRGFAGGASGLDTGMNALAAAALSGAVMTKLDGTNRLVVGSATHLYEKSGSSWTDVSRATPAYNASQLYPWRFAQFGDSSLAINKGDVLQLSSSGAFADVATAPKAAVMCVASGFVIAANTNDGTYGDSFDRWWCCAYLDVTDWTPAIATQCTTGRLVDSPGAITGMRAMGYDVVAYKDRSMYLGRYSGPPGVWDFTLIPGEIGCSSQEAIADIGTAHIFVGYEDIYLFNGATPQPIGAPLREWFFSDLDPGYRYRIRHAHDRDKATVFFYYPRNGSAGVLNGCIAYNYKSNKWGVAHRTIEAIVEYVSGGYTYDGLSAIVPTWDAWPEIAYDSPFWTASAKYPAYIGTDHKIYSLNGVSDSASFTTGDYGTANLYSLMSRVTPTYLTLPTTAAMTNYTQTVHGGAWTEGTTVAQSNGRFDMLVSAPWHKARFNLTGDFEITGLDADMSANGVL